MRKALAERDAKVNGLARMAAAFAENPWARLWAGVAGVRDPLEVPAERTAGAGRAEVAGRMDTGRRVRAPAGRATGRRPREDECRPDWPAADTGRMGKITIRSHRFIKPPTLLARIAPIH